jgi:hypothetical protein
MICGLGCFWRRTNPRGITLNSLHSVHGVLLQRVRISGCHLRILPPPSSILAF